MVIRYIALHYFIINASTNLVKRAALSSYLISFYVQYKIKRLIENMFSVRLKKEIILIDFSY